MSTACFYASFTEENINKMLEDDSVIDDLYYNEKYVEKTDIDTTHDVLANIYGNGFVFGGKFTMNAPGQGFGQILTVAEIKELVKFYEENKDIFTTEYITRKINELAKEQEDDDDEYGGIYRLECYQEFPDEVTGYLHELVEFYQKAVDNNLGILSFLG